jgi:hypothetical protein
VAGDALISSVDIEAWREDEKYADHVKARQTAVNHVGWAVEYLDERGWNAVSKVVKEYETAKAHMFHYKGLWPRSEFRVYEVVKGNDETQKF